MKACVRGIQFEYRSTSDPLPPIHLRIDIEPASATDLLCQSTPNLLQLLPFHTGRAANKSLCESTVDLLSQLPYLIVDAVYELLLLLLLLYADSRLLVSTYFLILSFLVTWDRE